MELQGWVGEREAIVWNDQTLNHYITCLKLRRSEVRIGCHSSLLKLPPPLLLWWSPLTWSWQLNTFSLCSLILLRWLLLNHRWYKSCVTWSLAWIALYSILFTLVLTGWPHQWGILGVGRRWLVTSLGFSSNVPGCWRQCKWSPPLWVGVCYHHHFPKNVLSVKGDNHWWLRGVLQGWRWWRFPQGASYQCMYVKSSFRPCTE